MLAAAALGAAAPGAAAQPPVNDGPYSATPFESYTAANGTPRDQEAFAELAEAGPDRGVPPCLGPGSFARTVWFSVPPMETPQEVTVEAEGRTLTPVDLAAFVQPEVTPPRAIINPNACAGLGSGGADAAEEPTSAVTLDVPPRHGVLIQVGRRGPVRSPEDERALLSLDARPLEPATPPDGDVADPGTPLASLRRTTEVSLGALTISEEDPAQPPCPSLGTVWRRVAPPRKEPAMRLISVTGRAASTLTVFAGRTPTAAGALDCVVRSSPGALQMLVKARPRRPLWVRVGADRAAIGSTAAISVEDAPNAQVVDGGRGGFDPTPGGPGGGLPGFCAEPHAERARIRGPGFRASGRAANGRRALALVAAVRGAALCDTTLELLGPRGHVYGRTRLRSLRGRHAVRFLLVRRLAKGAYRVRATALDQLGDYAPVRSTLRGTVR